MSLRPQRTEAEMLVMLRQRYTEKEGNGEAWAFVPHVRNAAGFDASRTADAVAMALWPSRGLVLHGFEIKVSRSDWLRELKKPEKAEGFAGFIDYWWLVAAGDEIVQPGELPDGWGMLVARGNRLVCRTEPAPTHDLGQVVKGRPLPPRFGRSFLAALLRSACRMSSADPAEIVEAREEARARAEVAWQQRLDRKQQEVDQLRELLAEFERASGIPLRVYSGLPESRRIGEAVKVVMDGDRRVEQIEQRLQGLRRQAAAIVEYVEQQLAHLPDEEIFF